MKNSGAKQPRRNYPASQQTGRQGELWVEQFFTNAGWTVGTYHIDDGYDLFVTPPRSEFDGQSFLVQVKGKASRQKGGVYAPVSRQRLRDYSANVMPVLIFRVFVETGSAFWVHAQAALNDNPRLAVGKAYAQVPMPTINEITTIDQFRQGAEAIILPHYRRENGVTDAIAARSKYLSSLDERIDVKVVQNGDVNTIILEQVALADSSAEVTAHIAGENVAAIEDMIHYGQSVKLESGEVRFHGSPVFTELGLDRPQRGTIEVESAYRQDCRVRLRTDKTPLNFAEELVIPCQLSRGSKGFTIQSTSSAVLSTTIRGSTTPNGTALNMKLHLPSFLWDGEELALKQGVGAVGQWAERVLARNNIYGEIVSGKRSTGFSATSDGKDPLLHVFVLLGKLHHIARVMNSNYQVPLGFEYSENEAWLIDAAYRMLTGETLAVHVTSITIDELEEASMRELDDYMTTTSVPITTGGKLVCQIPIKLVLRGYSCQIDNPDGEKILVSNPGSVSSMALGDLRCRTPD